MVVSVNRIKETLIPDLGLKILESHNNIRHIPGMSFVTLCFVHLFAVMSPGPGFAVAFRNSLTLGMRQGFITALGIALGDLVLIILSVSGASIVISQSPSGMKWLQLGGALYLGYIGVQSIRSFLNSKQQKSSEEVFYESGVSSKWLSFKSGFAITVMNPKAIIYFLSISSQFLGLTNNNFDRFFYSSFLIGITFLWFAFVALIVGNKFTRATLAKNQHLIEGVMGCVLIAYCLWAVWQHLAPMN